MSPPKMSNLASLLLPLLLLSLATVASAFNSGPCENEPSCNCKWQAGKKTADCSQRGFKVRQRDPADQRFQFEIWRIFCAARPVSMTIP